MMLKKLTSLLILAIALMFVTAQDNRVEARQQYVGSYSDGSDVYLLTETVIIQSRHPYSFNCTVKVGYDYLDYSFFPYKGSPYYRNSEGYEGYVNSSASPVASAIYRFVVNNY